MGFDLPVMNRLRRSGRALSPASLFATGAQGVIYDPRDLSTMFQDSLGTTPVTAPGQPVGLRLDKSKGLALGSERVSDPDFNSASSWTLSPNTTVSGGVCTFSGVTLNQGAQNNASLTLVAGRTYKVTLNITSYTSGGVRAYLGGTFGTVRASTGIFTEHLVAGADGLIILLAHGTATAVTDSISVKELPGNHAIQATAGDRLTYGIEPKTGTRNLLTQTEVFNEAVWTKSATTVTANAAVAPDGTTTADKMVETATTVDHFISRTRTLLSNGATYTLSYYAKAAERTYLSLYIGGVTATGVTDFNLSNGTITATSNNTVATIFDAGSGWYRCSVQVTTNSTSLTSYIYPNAGGTIYAGDGISGIFLWGAQLELGSVATPYQKVVTAFEVTEAGVPTCHYCAYAGANSMATAAIDFTATDKMSIFAGVRKVSTGPGILVELSSDSLTNNGAFGLFAPSGFGGDYYYNSRGTVSAPFTTGTGTYVPPINNIITGISDISGDLGAIRVNGIQVAQTTNNQGTGNYGNYPLYFGRQAGSTLPFIGRDYGIVIVGKATSAAEISITEAWLAANTPTVVL